MKFKRLLCTWYMFHLIISSRETIHCMCICCMETLWKINAYLFNILLLLLLTVLSIEYTDDHIVHGCICIVDRQSHEQFFLWIYNVIN